MVDVLSGERSLMDVLQEAYGMKIAPAGADLDMMAIRLAKDMAGAAKLAKVLRPVRGFDYVLIDCPPDLGTLTANALVAADELLIPVQCEFLAVSQLPSMVRTALDMRDVNKRLKLLGVLPTMYDGRTLHGREMEEHIRKDMAKVRCRVFPTIPRTVRLGETAMSGRPIFAYRGDGPGAMAYSALAQEVDQ